MAKKIYQCPCCEEELVITSGQLEQLNPTPDDIQPEADPSLYSNAYNNGVPLVPGVKEGGYVVNTPTTQNNSGIRVVTNVGDRTSQKAKPKANKFNPQPLGPMKGVFAPKKKTLEELTDADHSREGFTVEGSEDSFMDDFEGVSGAEGHMDRLMQQAILDDYSNRGIH